MKSTVTRKIFGDFQTPKPLASQMCQLLNELRVNPQVIIEPTCGKGNILLTAMEYFKSAVKGIGIEINADYIEQIKRSPHYKSISKKISLFHSDFFLFSLSEIDDIQEQQNKTESLIPGELLIIGNPPWVTNSELGLLDGQNLPPKSNFNNERGIIAITGKSNFDISESILIELIKKYSSMKYTLAILCKTSVARKILMYAWANSFNTSNEKIFFIDAKTYFEANVDACMLFFQNGQNTIKKSNFCCDLYENMSLSTYKNTIAYNEPYLISDIDLYEKSKYIEGKSPYIWRNGLKHDAAKILELSYSGDYLINGFGNKVEIESNLVFPFLKSSDIANGSISRPRKYVIVTQKSMGEDTSLIRDKYPQTWQYLEKYQSILDSRKSSIYKNKPKYSIFSIGEYTFSPYKIAISSLYKNIRFRLISSYLSKPYILDDTCNFIPVYSQEEGELLLELLDSNITKDFLNSIIFWDAKRVITTETLNRVDLNKIAQKIGKSLKLSEFKSKNKFTIRKKYVQPSLF